MTEPSHESGTDPVPEPVYSTPPEPDQGQDRPDDPDPEPDQVPEDA